MLDINQIIKDENKILAESREKGYPIKPELLKEILNNDSRRKELEKKIQEINAKRNVISNKNINEADRKNAKNLRKELQKEEEELKKVKNDLESKLYDIPNIPFNDVPNGKSEDDNELYKESKNKPKKFDFKVKSHDEIAENLGLVDIKRAVKVSGNGFAYLKGDGVLLELALINFVLNRLNSEGFTPVIPPVLILKNITEKLGYWNRGEHNDYYWVNEDETPDKSGFYLVGTAEHSLVPMHSNETLDIKVLPKRYIGFSTSFRRERGSYGKYSKGIFRLHQFDKIEMISYIKDNQDIEEQEKLLNIEMNLYDELEIPFRVVKSCKGELGFPIARKFDIEAWFPSLNEYKEVTSVSTTTDFQSRRLNIKYQDGQKKEFVHILNGTAFAIGRTIIAILENFQQKDGSVQIPKILHKYTGFKEIKNKS